MIRNAMNSDLRTEASQSNDTTFLSAQEAVDHQRLSGEAPGLFCSRRTNACSWAWIVWPRKQGMPLVNLRLCNPFYCPPCHRYFNHGTSSLEWRLMESHGAPLKRGHCLENLVPALQILSYHDVPNCTVRSASYHMWR